MISIKKFLASNEAEESLMHMVKLLLQGMAEHSVEGDPEEYTRFRGSIDQVMRQLDEEISTAELLVLSGSALKSFEDYNQRTNTYLRLQSTEFQAMVKMLTSTVSAITAAGDTSVRQLQEIEKQVEAATEIEDVRQIRGRLSECLDGIRRETERQRVEIARTAQELNRGLESAKAGSAAGAPTEVPAGPPPAPTDPVTGLPPRKAAEEVLARACQDDTPAYALAVAVDRIQILNTRFGYEVGDEILRYFAGFLKRQLPSTDLLFRWTGPILIALLSRPSSLARVRDEIGHMMEFKYQHTVRTVSRAILLPISTRWAVFPMMASPRMLIQKIDDFCSFQGSRD
ncbi:MAG: diguanylate cyclase [Acidobacteriia bacterium]|nr:diguanylate cyclase [Terriglobia bacterium]